MHPPGSKGLWVRFCVQIVPPLQDIRTFLDDLSDFFIDEVFRPLTDVIDGQHPPLNPPSGAGTRGDLSPDLYDTPPQEPGPPAVTVASLAHAQELSPLQARTEERIGVPNSVKIEQFSDDAFSRFDPALADFEMTVNLTQVPEVRRLDAAERVQFAVLGGAADLYFAVVKRLVNGPGPSRPGQPPAMVTGELVDSIRIVVSRDQLCAAVGTDLEHAAHLEYGTQHMDARPFLFPTFERQWPLIQTDIRKAASGEVPDLMKRFREGI